MPDQYGKLTTAEKLKASDYIASRWQLPITCPICKKTDWFIADHMVAPPITSPDAGMMVGGMSYPHILMISKQCGYTMFINAVMAGLLPPSGEQPPGREPGRGLMGLRDSAKRA